MTVGVIILIFVLAFAFRNEGKRKQNTSFASLNKEIDRDIDDFMYLDIISDGELDGDWD